MAYPCHLDEGEVFFVGCRLKNVGVLKVRMDYKSIVSWIGIANPDQHSSCMCNEIWREACEFSRKPVAESAIFKKKA
ncbi:hypothetical protein CLV48_1132 [Cecembia rubra]|uniref:Uncharacterized protein n=1 Tax=Cecembia rubra TaxID=1485585 RepID=A0A2P8DW10_9BACT|nr:hypothetical protein CLV48_1132 [Cecembia rubra]